MKLDEDVKVLAASSVYDCSCSVYELLCQAEESYAMW